MSDFKDLHDAAQKFLNSMSEATGLDKVKEEERARETVGFPQVSDSFNTRLDRLKRLVANPATLGEKVETEASPKVQVTAPKQASEPQQPVSNKVTEASEPVPPQNVFQGFVDLLEKMTGEKHLVLDTSWSGLDRMSMQIKRHFSVSLTNKTSKEDLASWLNDFVSLAEEVYALSPSWGSHQHAWKTWSQNTLKEMAALSGWINPQNEKTIDVPAAYIGAGEKIPKAPSSLKSLENTLQNFSDFFAWAKDQGSFAWNNSKTQSLFMTSWGELTKQETSSKSETEWKEKALDRYTILNARFTLLSSPSRDVTNTKKSSLSC